MKDKAFGIRLVVVLICAYSLLPVFSGAQNRTESFDKAIKETVVDLGPSPYYPGKNPPHGQLRCHYFPSFVVKELDWGQKGDDWISFAPNIPSNPAPCVQDRVAGEAMMPVADGNAGYFYGVKANLVFLSAVDCFNLGCPFGIYDPSTAKKLFEDQLRLSLKGKAAQIRFERAGQRLVMHYPRVVTTECSLPQKKTECWNKILRSTGLAQQPMPKCFGYGGFDKQTVFGTDDLSDPSVVSFQVEVTLPELKAHVPGGPVACWAAE